ncbi:MAG: HEPN domain-containing protein [Candidatus Woesearchaeota archaeon]
MIDEEECFKKGLLKKSFPQPDLAKKDIRQADFFLKEAEDLINMNKKHIAALSLYNAYFHTARSLLFKDGIKERSHYCIARYLESNYKMEKFINAFETMMSLRHNVQYATEKVDIEEDLSEFVNICHEFIDFAEKGIIKRKK